MPDEQAIPAIPHPTAGGVKIVFDVPEATADATARTVEAAGFDVQRYYPDGNPSQGGAAPGHVRLGAEQPRREFTDTEQNQIVASFDAVEKAAGFDCTRVGTDVWTSGNSGTAGVREPRRPYPKSASGAASIG
jgi:hypothetical protein